MIQSPLIRCVLYRLLLCLQIMLYLRMCLAYSAGTTPLSKGLADMQDDAPAIGRYVHTLLTSDAQPLGSKVAEANPVQVYMDLLQQLLSAIGGESGRAEQCIAVLSQYGHVQYPNHKSCSILIRGQFGNVNLCHSK